MKKSTFKDYSILPGSRKIESTERVSIGYLVFDKLGKKVLETHNKRFQGVREIENIQQYAPLEPITYSNTLQALSYDTILCQLTGGIIRVASPTDMTHHWDQIPEKSATFPDTNAVALFPKAVANSDLELQRQQVLRLLGRQTLEVPLLIEGLGVKKANNKDRFAFVKTSLTTITEAPFLQRDTSVSYDPLLDSLQVSDQGVRVYTPDDQSGICKVYRCGDEGLNFACAWLLSSSKDARVQIVKKDKKAA